MNRSLFSIALLLLAGTAPALAEVNVNVNIGLPAAQLVIPAPPRIYLPAPPLFLAPPGIGLSIAVDIPYDIVFDSGFYFIFHDNAWFRARHYNGPWSHIREDRLPPGLRKHRLDAIHSHRDSEFRLYREQGEHYRGKHFRPDKERKKELKEERKRLRKEHHDEGKHHGKKKHRDDD